MKILYFCQHFSTPNGSTGQRHYKMAQTLIDRGHAVTLICGSYNGACTGLTIPFQNGIRRGLVDKIDVVELQLNYLNNYNLYKRSLIFLKYAWHSMRFIFKLDYDLVFATSTPLTVAIPGIIARKFKAKPFVFEVRDVWPELPKAMGMKNPLLLTGLSILERLSYRYANHIIALAPGMVTSIHSRGVSLNKISMISNGCDLDLFQKKLYTERPVGVKEIDFMAIYAGTHGIANSLDAVLDAALELKKRNNTTIKFVLIGQGKLKLTLQQRAQKEQLNNVIFLDPLPKETIASLMQIADIGLQILANIPAFYNGTSPNKFFDYIAAGLPVLCNYPGWLAEQLIAYNCGIVVAPNNPSQFADALERAIENKSLLQEMGENALDLAKKKFDRQILAKQWVDIIEQARN